LQLLLQPSTELIFANVLQSLLRCALLALRLLLITAVPTKSQQPQFSIPNLRHVSMVSV
jgi:hypothetical protein